MKRHNDDEYGEGGKRNRTEQTGSELRLLIPSKCAGGVIGKGGENIKRLRSQYNAGISVPDSNSPERIITVTAEPENALECAREMLPKLEESKRADEMELRMLVHQSHAGAIIGRSGFKIKELREQTGANLKVFSQCCPMSTDRVVQINGAVDCIVSGIAAVNALLADIPQKGTNKPYDSINYDPAFVQEYGGYPPDRNWRGGSGGGGGGGGMGRGGSGSGRGGGDGYGRGPSTRAPYGGGGGGGGFDAGADYYGGAGAAMGAMGDMYGARRGPPPGAYMGGAGGYPTRPYEAPPMPMNFGGGGGGMGGASHTTQQVTIPTELGGTIIGKGGERINHIREDSGAHIVVDPPASGSDERIISITGTPSQIQMAQYLLQQCVRSSVAGRKYIQQQQGH